MLLCILGINLVNNNYPEEPCPGKAEKSLQPTLPTQLSFTYFLIWVYYF